MMQDLILYAQGVPPLPAEKQQVWNLMGQGKLAMDTMLQGKSLELQQTLTGYDQMQQPVLEKALKDYRAHWAIMVDGRKKFTSFLDLAKEQCMRWEKEYDPQTNSVYVAAAAKELKLREDAATLLKTQQVKAQEIADFKAFVVNQYHDITAQYRADLSQIIHQTYTACLSAKTPPDKVQGAINTCVAAMRDIKPRLMEKFQRKHDANNVAIISDAECSKLFDEVQKPNLSEVYTEAINNLQTKFSLYANDLHNPTAVTQQTALFQQEQQQATQQVEATKAANTLVAQATGFAVAPAGIKGVTETTEIKLEDYSDEWVVKIISAFLANFQIAMPKVKVKKKSGLSVAQMAAALDAASVKVEGVEYTTVKK